MSRPLCEGGYLIATTRIESLHAGKSRTMGKAIQDIIDYVENPQKTDGGRLISSFQCDSRIADAEFLFAKRQYLAKTGRRRGADDVIAYAIRQAETLWLEGRYDLLVLDVSLPDGSGFEFCKQVRQNSQVPIIFLTASDTETSIIMGLDIGGDDYITKPFKLAVLMSMVNAILRRSQHFQQTPGELCSNGITLQLLEGRAYKNGALMELTAAEYKLLRFFMEQPDIILSTEQIMGRLWDCDGNFVDGNTLAVYIRRLRAKIEDDPTKPMRIVTVRRMGYKWNVGGGAE